MNRSAVALVLAAIAGLAIAQPPKDAKPAQPPSDQPQMQLPPGWTMEDMQACVVAGTPGDKQALLQKSLGVWKGANKMWMPGSDEPMTSEATWTITSLFDGRYIKTEVTGDMPGMGPYHGAGVSGFDNVSQEFVCDWIDNHSTGIMTGKGTISDDHNTMVWKLTYTCPITKKPTVMRQIQKHTSPTAMTVEMFAIDPKSGKEYKMMQTELKKGG